MKRKLFACALTLALMLTAFTGCGSNSKSKESEAKEQGFHVGDTIYEQDGIKVVYSDFERVQHTQDEEPEYTAKFTVENNSSGKREVYVDDCKVNGIVIYEDFNAQLDKGEKSNKELYFGTLALEGKNVGEFKNIEITFGVSNECGVNTVKSKPIMLVAHK